VSPHRGGAFSFTAGLGGENGLAEGCLWHAADNPGTRSPSPAQ